MRDVLDAEKDLYFMLDCGLTLQVEPKMKQQTTLHKKKLIVASLFPPLLLVFYETGQNQFSLGKQSCSSRVSLGHGNLTKMQGGF